jgi:magnesium chelatase family protein
MTARIYTVAFRGCEVQPIDIQAQITNGMPGFLLVGLPDKAVAESRERVRGAFYAMGLALPAKRVAVNLAPADVTKEGSHFDLPIALALLATMEVLPRDEMARFVALGELALDGQIAPVAGVLPAAIDAVARERGLICPASQGGEAAWAGPLEIVAPPSLLALINHFKGTQVLAQPVPAPPAAPKAQLPDLADVRGQESARRAIEIAAAGNHNILLVGPPGAGKSMLAARLPGLLPPLSPGEALETSMIHSLAGELPDGGLVHRRPFRAPHHSASMPALIGGGTRARPGEVSLAHRGVLFLDELPEFQRSALEALRQPLESGQAVVARVHSHVTFPARFQLIAAMNPCRCGWISDAMRACTKAPRCAQDYQARISGPLLDRIDLTVETPAVSATALSRASPGEKSALVAARVAGARAIQQLRWGRDGATNADADSAALEREAAPDTPGQKLLDDAADRFRFSARTYHRVLRVTRTIADLDGAGAVRRIHVAEAISYRTG